MILIKIQKNTIPIKYTTFDDVKYYQKLENYINKVNIIKKYGK